MRTAYDMPTPSARLTSCRFLGPGALSSLVVGIALLSAACTPVPTTAPDDGAATTQAETADSPPPEAPTPCEDPSVQWSYSGEKGPQQWASLSGCFALCEAGQAQSPVAVDPGPSSSLPPLRFNYQEAPLRVANDGHTIRFDLSGKSSLDFGEMTFGLRQIYVHAPSEHTLRGREYPMELQLLHSSRESLAVVGVFVEAGDDNGALASLWEHLPQSVEDVKTVEGVRWQPSELLPASPATHRYAGSLTTPPCSENVRWILMDEPITLSQEKIDAFRALYDGNRRPLQELGDRQVASGE